MNPTGVLLMTFGTPASVAEIPEYLRSVRRGNDPSPELVAEFTRRYELVGGSPLRRITQAQAAALQTELAAHADGEEYIVAVGMLHGDPLIADAVASLAQRGVRRIIGIIMSPQYSPVIMAGYNRAFDAACAANNVEPVVAGPWHKSQLWIDTLSSALVAALGDVGLPERDSMPIIFTAHSVPKSVVEHNQDYLVQLHETAVAVALEAKIAPERWQFAYQSAGHTQQEWLTPDFKELLPQFAQAGHTTVLIVPVQFLCDHLEILYDIDVAGVEEAQEHGVTLKRVQMPNTNPRFIAALARVVERENSLIGV